MDLFIQYGLAAAQEALAQSGWIADTPEKQAVTGTIIGSGVGGSPVMAEAVKTIIEKGPRRLSPFTVPSFLANLAAGWISIRYGFKGPIGAPVTACAASAQAIGDAHAADPDRRGRSDGVRRRRGIGRSDLDRRLCGEPRARHQLQRRPPEASRPFDKGHAGFVLAEGAAVVVIERLSHALARGAKPLAIAAGYGTSADAYHLTSGSPDGAGAQVAMRKAIEDGGADARRYRLRQRPRHLDRSRRQCRDQRHPAICSAIAGRRWRCRRPSRPPATCWARPGPSRRCIRSWRCATRCCRRPSTLPIPRTWPKQFDLVPLKRQAEGAEARRSATPSASAGVNASLVFSAV